MEDKKQEVESTNKISHEAELKTIKKFIYYNCANFDIRYGCPIITCKTDQEKIKFKCCYSCPEEKCNRYRKCSYYDKIVYPIMEREMARRFNRKCRKKK